MAKEEIYCVFLFTTSLFVTWRLIFKDNLHIPKKDIIMESRFQLLKYEIFSKAFRNNYVQILFPIWRKEILFPKYMVYLGII